MARLNLPLAGIATIILLSACSSESSRSTRSGDSSSDASRNSNASRPTPAGTPERGESLPPGVKLQGGATIPKTDYVFRRVTTPRGDALWLDSIVRRGGRTAARIRRAELALPPLAADERLMLASCDVNGRLDPFVVAIVVSEANVTRYTKVRQAWRASPSARRFDIIPIAGIVCEDPGS